MVVAQQISGMLAASNRPTIEESFSFVNGKAEWRNAGRRAAARNVNRLRFTLPDRDGPQVWLDGGLLVRAAIKRMDGELPLFPDGTARLREADRCRRQPHDGRRNHTQPVRLSVAYRFQPGPLFAWCTTATLDLLAARDLGRMGMTAAIGWRPRRAGNPGIAVQGLARTHFAPERLLAGTEPAQGAIGPVLFASMSVLST